MSHGVRKCRNVIRTLMLSLTINPTGFGCKGSEKKRKGKNVQAELLEIALLGGLHLGGLHFEVLDI
jgi:hypothetical protein